MNEGVRENEEEGLRLLLWCWSGGCKEKKKRREWKQMGTKAWGKVAGEGSGKEEKKRNEKTGKGLRLPKMSLAAAAPQKKQGEKFRVRVFCFRVFYESIFFGPFYL